MVSYKSNTKGVTLMEMLIVVAIIGILATISMPNFITMVRNNRVKARSLALLSALRNERSRALSLNRQIEMQIDEQNKTYTTTQLAYTLYDPLSPDLFHPIILNTEGAETLQANTPFDKGDWLVEGVEISPDPFTVTFTPSGTIQIPSVVTASVKLNGEHIGYEITLYRAGQISISRF